MSLLEDLTARVRGYSPEGAAFPRPWWACAEIAGLMIARAREDQVDLDYLSPPEIATRMDRAILAFKGAAPGAIGGSS